MAASTNQSKYPIFLRNLIPRRENRPSSAKPLLTVVSSLSITQYLLFLSGYIHLTHRPHFYSSSLHFCSWLAWTVDATDFFSVSLSVERLTIQFNRSTHEVVRAIHIHFPLVLLNISHITDNRDHPYPSIQNSRCGKRHRWLMSSPTL
jgi:hypothetical protein